ncbi:hypothetical protein D3C74_424240 [compost metagenome]
MRHFFRTGVLYSKNVVCSIPQRGDGLLRCTGNAVRVSGFERFIAAKRDDLALRLIHTKFRLVHHNIFVHHSGGYFRVTPVQLSGTDHF